MKFWAIKQVSTGFFLPETNGGYTHFDPVGPNSCYTPRLFTTKGGAARARTAWLKGMWMMSGYGEDASGPDPEKPESGKRNPEDMVVVRLLLTTVRMDDDDASQKSTG